MAVSNEPQKSSWASLKPTTPEIKEPTLTDVMNALSVVFAKVNSIDTKIDGLSKNVTTNNTVAPASVVQPTVDPKLDNVNKEFDEELQYVKIEDKGNFFYIKATKFLGAEVFAKIGAHCRALGATYISAGKDTHWELKKSDIKI